ncbi:hypothetical protein D6827_01895 [Candidatus Parcubacteria bacterium]|nr:MAG: hypothetical protein D6827_01895 [Candidatus Parcubacteria bacterium]
MAEHSNVTIVGVSDHKLAKSLEIECSNANEKVKQFFLCEECFMKAAEFVSDHELSLFLAIRSDEFIAAIAIRDGHDIHISSLNKAFHDSKALALALARVSKAITGIDVINTIAQN